jgi:Lysylphosphatidylglycerol synthase TM region
VSTGAKLLLSAAIAVGLVSIVGRWADWTLVAERLAGIRLGWVAAAGASLLTFVAFKWQRLRVVLPGTRRDLFAVQCQQVLLNALLPLGLGEVAFVYLIRRLDIADVHAGTAAVLVGRVADVAFFIVAVALVSAVFAHLVPLGVLAVLGGLTVMLLGAFSIYVGASRPAVLGLDCRGSIVSGLLARVIRHVGLVAVAIRDLAHPAVYIAVAVHTAGMWTAMYLFFLSIVFALTDVVSALDVLWLFILLFLADAVPIRGLLNIGSHHAAWFVILNSLGVGSAEAAAIAFGSHIVFMAVTVTLALPATLVLIWQGKRPCLSERTRTAP